MSEDDDSKENNVTPAAANMLLSGTLPDPLKNPAPANEVIAVNGGLEQLEALFRNHYVGMFRVAYRITGSESDAEDALQTVFARLTAGWELRDLSPNPRAFLHRSALNASFDIVRRRKRANSVPLDLVDFDQGTRLASPAENLEDTELRELVRQAVAKLEGRAATAFALRYYEG